MPGKSAGQRGGKRPWQKSKPKSFAERDARAKENRRARREGRSGPPTHRFTHEVVLYGWHPVVEALRNPKRKVRRIMATENGHRRLMDELGSLPLEPEIVHPREIDAVLTPDAVHQGLLIECDPLKGPALDAVPANALLLVLDQITDPHNVGAILRSAAAFGVDAVITTERHSPVATGVLAKAASGGLEHVPIITVKNLGDALELLGRQNVLRVGLDSEGAVPMQDVAVRRPLALILGAEGKGLRQRTRETCDVLARLDMPGAIKSLNVSNAAAISLYALAGRLGV
ncbi:MAG: 23S rRNA (guanosine(2251)-2'-O)-methyltransferase RlmB [Beijerinckiaceae bacterium]